MSSKITVGKIVSSATDTGWSQAYHAGGFTAVISLSKKEEGGDEKSLAGIGKELLDTLVAEYFTLTTKDLETVKQAVSTTMSKAPKHVEVGLVVASVIKNILYAVIANEGRILLKRGDKLGLLLDLKPEEEEKIASASGFLEANDIVLLHSPAFGRVFTHDELSQSFDHKSAEELAETFAPKVHGAENGAASALVFSYHEDEAVTAEEPLVHKAKHEEKIAEETREKPADAKPLLGFESPIEEKKAKTPFSHRQKLFLTITIILAVVLIGSIFVFLNRQQAAKQEALFQSIYAPANTKFSEAKGLLDLNRALAIEDLSSAQQSLIDAKSKFPAGSDEEKKITTLLSGNSNPHRCTKSTAYYCQQSSKRCFPAFGIRCSS